MDYKNDLTIRHFLSKTRLFVQIRLQCDDCFFVRRLFGPRMFPVRHPVLQTYFPPVPDEITQKRADDDWSQKEVVWLCGNEEPGDEVMVDVLWKKTIPCILVELNLETMRLKLIRDQQHFLLQNIQLPAEGLYIYVPERVTVPRGDQVVM